MDHHSTAHLLDELQAMVGAQWSDVADDRALFFKGLKHLQAGQLDEASRSFRRATRHSEPPFDMMAQMARARCEVVRGHQAAALRIFLGVAKGDGPIRFRRLAWMEIGDIAQQRGDDTLRSTAREALAKTRESTTENGPRVRT